MGSDLDYGEGVDTEHSGTLLILDSQFSGRISADFRVNLVSTPLHIDEARLAVPVAPKISSADQV
jgi:hypothetical protein